MAFEYKKDLGFLMLNDRILIYTNLRIVNWNCLIVHCKPVLVRRER